MRKYGLYDVSDLYISCRLTVTTSRLLYIIFHEVRRLFPKMDLKYTLTEWNKLSEYVISADNTNQFKNRLDGQYLNNKFKRNKV